LSTTTLLGIVMTADSVRRLLAQRVAEFPSIAAYAQRVGVSDEHVRLMLAGRREPAGKVLAALELERVAVYRKVRREVGNG
jgi:hypothetical protein